MRLFNMAFTIGLALLLSGLPAAQAQDPNDRGSGFNAESVENGILSFYDLWSNRNQPVVHEDEGPLLPDQAPWRKDLALTDADKMTLAALLAKDLSKLEPKHDLKAENNLGRYMVGLVSDVAGLKAYQANSIVTHMLARYEAIPEDREAIALMLGRYYEEVLPELRALKEANVYTIIADDIITVWNYWALAGVVVGGVKGGVKGIVKSRGLRLSAMETFKKAVKTASKTAASHMPLTKKKMLIAAGLGPLLSGAREGRDLALKVFFDVDSKRMDPLPALAGLQEKLITSADPAKPGLAMRARAFRDDMHEWLDHLNLIRREEDFTQLLEPIQALLKKRGAELGAMIKEAAHLQKHAAHVGAVLEYAMSDIKDAASDLDLISKRVTMSMPLPFLDDAPEMAPGPRKKP